jgi:hypothetical protein
MKLFGVLSLLFVALAMMRADPVPAEKVYGPTRATILRNATAGRAQRISIEYQKSSRGESVIKIGEQGEEFALRADVLSILQRALLRDSSDEIASKLCMPMPGIRFVLQAKSESISVLVCYSCRMVLVEERGRIAAQRDGDDIISDLKRVAASFLPEEEVSKLR